MRDAVVISAVRTPVGKYLGALREMPARELGALVLDEAARRAGVDPAEVDDVIFAQSYQNGESVNTARMALLKAGWPESVPGLTIDRRCCGGLDAVCQAALRVQAGSAEMVVAGGVESMSNAEFYLPGSVKWGIGGSGGRPKGHGDLALWGIPLYDRIQRARVMSQPEERYGVLPSMMSWAEEAARAQGVTREACDGWAVRSHLHACRAWEEGRFSDEVVAVTVDDGRGATLSLDRDEGPRADTSLERLARLKPVLGGVCTAGNSSSENDGAAALVVTTRQRAEALGVRPLGRFVTSSVVGVDPRKTWTSVPAAVSRALAQAGLGLDDLDLVEVQEAFAAQTLADLKELGLTEADHGRVNVNGSGISLGHPIGCTGARVLVTLLHEMRRRGARHGLEAICGGGGLGIAAVFAGET
ncbi:MAG: acetyl-CoA C-acyltransferase [Deltaproteobacteria bacterium]|nr:acetyl-CoA C-acyltransferase [Deltaproteobacteria bacterium]